MYDLLARLFDDQPNTVVLISAHDGCIEFINHGSWRTQDGVTTIGVPDVVGRDVQEVLAELGFPPDHVTMRALRDGNRHIALASSPDTPDHWVVAAKLRSGKPDSPGYVFTSSYPGTQEDALERHARDVSRAMIAVEFEAVRGLLDAASDTIRVAQQRAETAFGELEVIRWAVTQDATGR